MGRPGRIGRAALCLLVLAAAVVVVVEEDDSGAVRSHRHPRAIASVSAEERAPKHHAPKLSPHAAAMIARLLRSGQPIYCAGHRGREIALTFDDGPGPYTGLALRKLARAHERGTFFVVGRNIPPHPRLLRRELADGVIGDHSYTHPVLTALPPAEIRSELADTAAAIRTQTGEHVDLFRPPYELHNATVDAIARNLKLLEILWSVDSADSLGANWAQIIRNVAAGLRPGAIILLHENRGQTIRALTTVLPILHRRHLRSVTVPDLLASDPPSGAQLRAGPYGCGRTARPSTLSGA